jgi:uncharacterized protein DUF4424
LGVDVAGFGRFFWDPKDNPTSRDIQGLSSSQQKDLAHLGLIDSEINNLPNWRVVKTYHWRQTFPSRKTIQVRHEYKPVLGLGRTFGEGLSGADQALGPHSVLSDQSHGEEVPEIEDVKVSDACVDPPLLKLLMAAANRKDREGYFRDFYAYWVDYILTTANTWKTPIKDFELVIERPKPAIPTSRVYVSLCWDGKIEQKDADHFVAKKLNFIPTKELRVMFFEVPK